MKSSTFAAWLLGATLAIAGCNGTSDDDTRGPEPAVSERSDTTATGTSGSQANASQPAATDNLPETASPLPLIAGIGVLSLCAAAALRFIRPA